MRVRITEGEQRNTMSVSQLKSDDSMVAVKVINEVYNDFVPVSTKYDLIGNIATDTGLTRHTIIEILKNIRQDVKYIYFIAETKGSMQSAQLKGAEKGKIECARKHFKSISDGTVKYDVVNTYEHLIDLVTGVTPLQ